MIDMKKTAIALLLSLICAACDAPSTTEAHAEPTVSLECTDVDRDDLQGYYWTCGLPDGGLCGEPEDLLRECGYLYCAPEFEDLNAACDQSTLEYQQTGMVSELANAQCGRMYTEASDCLVDYCTDEPAYAMEALQAHTYLRIEARCAI